MIFGLYYNLAKVDIGFGAGLRAFTAAVLGGIGNVPGAMLGGVLIGLIEAFAGQTIGTAWSDVVIFGLLVLVLVFQPVRPARPAGAEQVVRGRAWSKKSGSPPPARSGIGCRPERRKRARAVRAGRVAAAVPGGARQRRRHRQRWPTRCRTRRWRSG